MGIEPRAKPVSELRPADAGVESAAGSAEQLNGLARLSRWAFAVLAAAFTLCVLVQIYIAGMAIFVHPLNWARHTTFIHFFELLPILMLVFSFLGKLPGRLRWQSAGLFGLIYVQYFTANVRAILPVAAALHPVVAMGILWLSVVVLRAAWYVVRRRRMQ